MTHQNTPTEGVALTAIGVALIRERESRRPDRLYDDPLATAFVDAARRDFTRTEAGAAKWARVEALAEQFFAGRSVGVRLVDDRVTEAVAAGCRQIVLLGAGLDTRAFRMGLPADVTVYELDLPELFAFKEPVLRAVRAAPTARRHVLPIDLRTAWAVPLRERGFRSDLPTHWVDEGALPYLPPEDHLRTVATLTTLSVPGSRFGLSRFAVDSDAPPYAELRRLVSGDDAPMPPLEAGRPGQQWLVEHGWHVRFRTWDDEIVPLGRDVAVHDPKVGVVLAERV
ncbi:SAM-dependent methyltransferase [Nocardia alba]|uniref:S-adenosyl-L-methionine-dependent methyltransferase n=1 Tax=Nocardia alba TaxID=225051 RepID=A0A4R1FNX7_9NOCA|nr:SAM-dependent methyltransferase [Nocardia alba]TCJ95134.1 methyltransferase (TIGR00027 family) [Nocardia alba]